MWKSFIFPAGTLIASIILAVRYEATMPSMVVAGIFYLAGLIWLIRQVETDGDNQWLPSAITIVCPIIIGVANGTNYF